MRLRLNFTENCSSVDSIPHRLNMHLGTSSFLERACIPKGSQRSDPPHALAHFGGCQQGLAPTLSFRMVFPPLKAGTRRAISARHPWELFVTSPNPPGRLFTPPPVTLCGKVRYQSIDNRLPKKGREEQQSSRRWVSNSSSPSSRRRRLMPSRRARSRTILVARLL